MWTLVVIDAVLALAAYLMARKAGLRFRPILLPLLIAPAVPAPIAYAWALIFRVEPGVSTPNPGWVVSMPTYLFYASVALSLAALALARGYRLPTAIFALPQIPLTWTLGLGAAMAVTGVYL